MGRFVTSPASRVALFGGTFNPIHLGHIAIANYLVVEKGWLDLVHFVPTYVPPHKAVEEDITAKTRYHMVDLALAEECRKGTCCMDVVDWEMARGHTSYTIDTVRWWVHDSSEKNVEQKYIIIGADSAAAFTVWRHWQEIIEYVRVLVYHRPGYEDWFEQLSRQPGWQKSLEDRFVSFVGPEWRISSSDIRRMIHEENEQWQKWLPDSVAQFIQNERLYYPATI